MRLHTAVAGHPDDLDAVDERDQHTQPILPTLMASAWFSTLPWLHDPALSGFQPALSARDPAPHLVISTCRATAGTYPSPAAALRTTALAQISALGPILR